MPVPVESAGIGGVRPVVPRHTDNAGPGQVDIVVKRQIGSKERRALVRGLELQRALCRRGAELDVQRRFREIIRVGNRRDAAFHGDGVRRHIHVENSGFGQIRVVDPKDLAPRKDIVVRVRGGGIAFQRPAGVFPAAKRVDQRPSADPNDGARRKVVFIVVLIVRRKIGRSRNTENALRKRFDQTRIEPSHDRYVTRHVDETAVASGIADKPRARSRAVRGAARFDAYVRDCDIRRRLRHETDQTSDVVRRRASRGGSGRVGDDTETDVRDGQSVCQVVGGVFAGDAPAGGPRRKRERQNLAARGVPVEGNRIAVIDQITEYPAGIARRGNRRSGSDRVGVQQIERNVAARVGTVIAEESARALSAGHAARYGVIGHAEDDPGGIGNVIDVADDAPGVARRGRNAVDAGIVRRVEFEDRVLAHHPDDAAGVPAGGGDRKSGTRSRRRHGKRRAVSERPADITDATRSADRDIRDVREGDRHVASGGDRTDQPFVGQGVPPVEGNRPACRIRAGNDVVGEQRPVGERAFGRRFNDGVALDFDGAAAGDGKVGGHVIEERAVEKVENVDAAGRDVQRPGEGTALGAETDKVIIGNGETRLDRNVQSIVRVAVSCVVHRAVRSKVGGGADLVGILGLFLRDDPVGSAGEKHEKA